MVHGSWLLRAPMLLLKMPFTPGGLEYPSALACLAGRLEHTSPLVFFRFRQLSRVFSWLSAHSSWLLRVSMLLVKLAINGKRVGISERSGMVAPQFPLCFCLVSRAYSWRMAHGSYVFRSRC